MKEILAIFLGASLFASPALALAQALPIGPTSSQLLTAVAAIEAQEAALQNNEPLACVALFSAPSVAVNEPVILAWGSAGAVSQTKDTANMWPLAGASTISIQTPGAWTYSFVFYDAAGASTTCDATITVKAAQ